MAPSIFKMFARSPIGPLEEHMAKAHTCCKHLIAFLDKAIAGDWEAAEKLQIEISQLESEADDIKKDLRLHLPKGLFMPVPRTDVLELLIMQDRVANKAEDIAGLMMGRKMQIPQTLGDNFKAFLSRSVDASSQANKAINELDELLETGFQGNEVTLVESMIHELDRIERDTDDMQVKLRRELFALENDLPPVQVIFLYKIIDWIGELADHAQQVGKRLQLLLAR